MVWRRVGVIVVRSIGGITLSVRLIRCVVGGGGSRSGVGGVIIVRGCRCGFGLCREVVDA